MVPIVSAVSYGVVDTAGGGERVVVTVDDSAGSTTIAAGGVNFTSFAIDDGTHVSGIPGAHAAGVVNVIVTNATGGSIGGAGLIEYWSPINITGVTSYWDSDKSVTDAGAGAVSSWISQVGIDDQVQAVGANRPIQTASVFGTIPSIRFTPEQWLAGTGEAAITPFSYFAVVKYTSSDATAADTTFNVPLTILGGSGWNGFGFSAGAIAYKSFDVAEESWGTSINDGNPHIAGMTSDATPTRKGYKDGVEVGSASALGGSAASYWDHIGNGLANVDGFDGDIGAIITLGATVISGGDLTKLTNWAKQRFGTP